MYHYFLQGGWPMVPLTAFSVIAMAIIIERLFALRRGAVMDEDVGRQMESAANTGRLEGLAAACQRSRRPLAEVAREALRLRDASYERQVDGVQAEGRRQLGRLERGLVFLEIIAGVSPLIGLLGTVLGMVTVFNAITERGVGNPAVLSDGISKALVTTIAGLVVGIPALAFHSWFSRRAEALATEIHDRAMEMLAALESHD